MICLVVGDVADVRLDRLEREVPGLRCVPARDATPASLAGAEALFVWDFRWRSLEDLLPLLPRLRWIHTASAGVDHIVVPPVIERRIAVSNSAGVFERPIAEYVLALVLAHAKGLLVTAEARLEHRWAYRETDSIAGATVVVAGAGRIGRAVGTLARSAGMRVIGVNRDGRAGGESFDRVVAVTELEVVASAADYLVITAALTPETRGLVGRSVIAALPRSAYVINVARSPLLDLDALVDALRAGRIAGAALDVFDEEPLPADSPVWSVPNLFVSPHMSGDATGWRDAVVDLFVANARRFLAGSRLATPVDTARGY